VVLDVTAAAQAGQCDAGPGDDTPNAEIVAFYTAERDEGRGLYDIWEAGEAWGDSITPAVSCLPYRRMA
jgi:hypothetical protein